MPTLEQPMHSLKQYLPEGSFDKVVHFLHQYKVHLTISRERTSILGDYRNAVKGKNHRISVNGNLNKYAFLITLLHELAHLLAFENFGNRIASHGKEWKKIYADLLSGFTGNQIFPEDINLAIQRSQANPAASSCADADLVRILTAYDERKENVFLIETLPAGAHFKTSDGKIFVKGVKLRKRYKCRDIHNDREYLFSPVYAVQLVKAVENS